MRTANWAQSVSVLDRVSAILDAFPADGRGLTITEIAHRARLPKSTVSRLVKELVESGYIDRVGGAHHLGVRLYELGLNVEEPRRLRQAAGQSMRQLSDATGHCSLLAVDDGAQRLVIASVRVSNDMESPRVGEWLPDGLGSVGAEAIASISHPIVEHGEAVALLAVCAVRDELDPRVSDPLVRASAAAISTRLAELQRAR